MDAKWKMMDKNRKNGRPLKQVNIDIQVDTDAGVDKDGVLETCLRNFTFVEKHLY